MRLLQGLSFNTPEEKILAMLLDTEISFYKNNFGPMIGKLYKLKTSILGINTDHRNVFVPACTIVEVIDELAFSSHDGYRNMIGAFVAQDIR